MIFKPEMVEKILAGEKTVTRRPVKEAASGGLHGERWAPCRYEVGKHYAVQPARGTRSVGRIFVKRVDRKPLGGGLDWSISEAEREGFRGWPEFLNFWLALYGDYDATQLVDRIEFELAEPGGSERDG